MDEITGKLVDFVLSARPGDLPEGVLNEARRSFFNIVGCMLGGARHETVEVADAALAPFEGQAQATLVGRGRRTDPLHAALINCLSSSVWTYDDTIEPSIAHPSGSVASAALALVERRPVSGAELLTAFALGVELVGRLAAATTAPVVKGNIAWCATSITGGIGAAAAAGRLLGLDKTRMHWAIGVALSQASGFRVTQGTMNHCLLHSYPAEDGLRGALLAERGFTGAMAPLEGRYGFLSMFADEPDVDALVGGLGERFHILRNSYKPFPAGIVIHPIIDACLQLRKAHAIDGGQIARVTIDASPGAIEICDRPHPQSEKMAIVSLQHWAAIALNRGTASPADLDMKTAVRDPAIQAFQDKVEAKLDASLANDATVVTVTMTDGRQHVSRVDHAIGSAQNPMSDADLERKFVGQAEPVVGPARARELAERTWAVGDLADVGDLTRAAA